MLDEAVAVDRRLVELNPGAYSPALAEDLQFLTSACYESGHFADALSPAEDTVAVYERLAQDDPIAHLTGLGMARKNLGVIRAALGDPAEGLRLTEEAVTILRSQVEQTPDGNLSQLAECLEAYANQLSHLGRHDIARTRSRGAAHQPAARRAAAPDPRRHAGQSPSTTWASSRPTPGTPNLP